MIDLKIWNISLYQLDNKNGQFVKNRKDRAGYKKDCDFLH